MAKGLALQSGAKPANILHCRIATFTRMEATAR
jgi:hypothetical protein